jgi:predicted GIY-YIG superfamily endonuclease
MRPRGSGRPDREATVSAEPLPPTTATGRPTAPVPASPTTPAPTNAPRGTVYLLHFDQRYVHAGHYTGWANDLDQRLAQHQRGTGARLVEVITQAGIGFRVARLWPGASKAQERSLKNSGGASRYCPICRDERKARGELRRPPRSRGDRHPDRADQAPPRRARNRGRESASGAVPTRGVRPGQARQFMALNPAFARPVSGSLAQQWGRVRGREEIEALSPRVTGARFEENQQLSQQRTTAVIRRAVQARVQARQRQLDERAEQARPRAVAGRAYQRLLTSQSERAGQRPRRRDRSQPTSNPREGGHER